MQPTISLPIIFPVAFIVLFYPICLVFNPSILPGLEPPVLPEKRECAPSALSFRDHDQAMPSRQARQTRDSRVWVFVVKIIGRDFRKRFESSQRKDSMPEKRKLPAIEKNYRFVKPRGL